MENYITKDNEFYNDVKNSDNLSKYKLDIDEAIKAIISKEDRLVFASVVKVADITNITVFKYPELRGYILEKIKFEKEIQAIDKKIDRAIARLNKGNRRITFISLMNSCKFNSDHIYNNPYIKEKIRAAVIENTRGLCKKK
ncbi:hypothetical protein [Clostridium sulfidigenes]|uniref:hypothetical protein n=1 Tax=Clostridium sulfidigenes TaxID=318464 RepID=UPI003F8B5ED0